MPAPQPSSSTLEPPGSRVDERVGPLLPGVVDDPALPRDELVGDRVVRLGDEPCPRVAHSTSTVSSRAAASARSSAWMFVSAIAIT